MTTDAPPLSQPEAEVLQLLDTANTTLTSHDGRVRWALHATDVCALLELGGELFGAAVDPATSNRLAYLLGADGN